MSYLDIAKAVAPGLAAITLAAVLLYGVDSIESTARKQGYAQAQSEGEAAIQQLRGQHLLQDLERAKAAEASAKAATQRLQEEVARNDKLAADLANQQRIHRQTTDRLSGEIARVNDLYRKALDAEPEPLPACVFTAGFVRVWDEAIGARAPMPETADPVRAAAQSTDAIASEQLDSGISQRAVLAHHVRYAEQCRNMAAQLDALIDAVQETH